MVLSIPAILGPMRLLVTGLSLAKHPSEYPHAVEEQRRVGRMM
ncbi:MAG: hypothetical protein QOI57_2799 [Rubrobacteraceae bacterium]|nr:hypothetical protein [Rubrobacteraceae bacterium]